MIKQLVSIGSLLLCMSPVFAQEEERGRVTNLDLPRFVSINAEEAYVRRGPGMTHRIDWVFLHRQMPVLIVDEYEHWRRVQDRDGAGGWVHYSLLSGTRTVIVEQDMLPLFAEPNDDTRINAYLALDVIARIVECMPDWCRLIADGHRGWAPKTELWGVDADEIID